MKEGQLAARAVRARLLGRPLAVGAAALLAGIGAGSLIGAVVIAHQAQAHVHAAFLPTAARNPPQAPDFTLRDQNGSAISLHGFSGRTVLVTFMDPRCTAGCPIAGRELASIEGELGAAAAPALLVISVAPDRTTADVEHFASQVSWRPGWHWLLGSQAQLAPVWAAYHVTVAPGAGDVLHDQLLEVIDPRGRIRAEYAAPLPMDEVTRLIQKTQHTEVRT